MKDQTVRLSHKVWSGWRFCCSHSRQADLHLEKNLIRPFLSLTSHC